MVIRPVSWEKFQPAVRKMKVSILIQHETKKLADISARSVRKVYIHMDVSNGAQKLASISASFKKTSNMIH